jgi:hypothetical protein
MSKTAGITAYPITTFNDIGVLKQSLLFFDVLGHPYLPMVIKELKRFALVNPIKRAIINELEYLKENNLLFDAYETVLKFQYTGKPEQDDFFDAIRLLDKLDKASGKTYNEHIAIRARLASVKLNLEHHDYQAIPIVDSLSSNLINRNKAEKTDVIRLVIDNIPVPDDQTPWENIISFKKDLANAG